MNYISLQEIKKQCLIDQDFTEDDSYLEALGDAAEEKVNEHVGFTLDEIVAENGGLPATLRLAMLLFVSYMYDNRGIEDKEIPRAFASLCQAYVIYPIA